MLEKWGIPYLAAILIPFLSSHPYWETAWMLVVAVYGIYLTFSQQELNDFIEFIKGHPDVFIEDVVSDPDFRAAFLITFESMLKSRSEAKRSVIKEIFWATRKQNTMKILN